MSFEININNTQVEVHEGETLLTVLRKNGIKIPTLCYMAGFTPSGACRLCVVEVEGKRDLITSCTYPVEEGMVVKTNSSRVIKARKSLVEMLLANHPDKASAGAVLNCAGGLNHRPEELYPPLTWVMGAFTWLVSSPRVGPLVFNQVRRKGRIRSSLQQVYRDRAAVTDELIEMIYTPACKPTAQKVFASIVTAPPGPKPDDLLPNITQPLLVLWGENDPWTPIKGADIYRQLAEEVARPGLVTFHSIPNTGHCPHDERPEVVNPLLVDWVGTLPKG